MRLGQRVHMLRGNHDAALLRFLTEGDLPPFAAMGGLQTIASYVGARCADPIGAFRNQFPQRHRRLLEATDIYFEDDGLLVSHAGFDPGNPTSRDESAMVFGKVGLFSKDRPRQPFFAVCGHYVQSTMRPYISADLACIDTGCGTIEGGPLTVFLWPEIRFVTFGKSNG
jgi:hypothetical protein